MICAQCMEFGAVDMVVCGCGHHLHRNCYLMLVRTRLLLRCPSCRQAFRPGSQIPVDVVNVVNAPNSNVQQQSLCTICQDEINEPSACIPCFHRFHDGCLRQWLIHSPTCPLCRTEINIERVLLYLEHQQAIQPPIQIANQQDNQQQQPNQPPIHLAIQQDNQQQQPNQPPIHLAIQQDNQQQQPNQPQNFDEIRGTFRSIFLIFNASYSDDL